MSELPPDKCIDSIGFYSIDHLKLTHAIKQMILNSYLCLRWANTGNNAMNKTEILS